MRGRGDSRGVVCSLLTVVLAVVLDAALPRQCVRAQGFVQALTELRVRPGELGDGRRPLTQRVDQARALGAFGPAADAVPTLLAALQSNPPPALRDELLLALARRAPAVADVPLAALLEHDEQPPLALTMALGAIATPRAIAALAAALARPRAAAAAERGLLVAGPRAAAPLAQALSSAVGVRAAEVLAGLGPDAAAAAGPALVRALDSEAPDLRAAAARALGALKVPGSAAPLLARLRDPAPTVVSAALEALGRVATAADAPLLLAHLRGATPADRALALAALAAADPTLAAQPLERALGGSDRALRDAAVRLLEGAAPHPRWVPLLERSFAAELREATASALARVPDGRGLAALLARARRSPDAAQRAARALALGLRRFGPVIDAATVRGGHELLRSLASPERNLWLRALARDRAVVEPIRAGLASKNAELRATAAFAAALLGDAELAPALLAALSLERDQEAARRMLEAAAQLGSQPSQSVLLRWLSDQEVAPEAMLLAAATAEPGAVPRALRVRLRRALSSPDALRLRVAAALALGQLGDTAARPALEAALADPSARLRLAAVRALAALGGRSSALALTAHARVERDGLVRREALHGAALGGVPAPLFARGELALEVRLREERPPGQQRPLVDVWLPDGRWLRLRTLPGGELLVPDLAPGQADVRAVD
jgi:HEAT repeat protein